MDCGKLEHIEHGTVTLETTRTTHGAVAIYACHENYTLIGETRRVCGDGGKWNGTEPQCLFDWCAEPPQISGGIVTTSGRRTGSVATYSCEPGFILFGSNVSYLETFVDFFVELAKVEINQISIID